MPWKTKKSGLKARWFTRQKYLNMVQSMIEQRICSGGELLMDQADPADQADLFWYRCFIDLQATKTRFRWNTDDPELDHAELWLAEPMFLQSGLLASPSVVR